MATTSHKNITDSQLHECKGAASATTGKVPIATGSGTATFRYINQRGFVTFFNLGSPYNLTYPASFTKIAPTTTGEGQQIETVEESTASVKYVGTGNVYATITAKVSLSQSTGSNKDIELAIYKNGSLISGSHTIKTLTSGEKDTMIAIAGDTLTTNDRVEAYIKNDGGSGDLAIYAFSLNLVATRG